jgi:hypothetical protein
MDDRDDESSECVPQNGDNDNDDCNDVKYHKSRGLLCPVFFVLKMPETAAR